MILSKLTIAAAAIYLLAAWLHMQAMRKQAVVAEAQTATDWPYLIGYVALALHLAIVWVRNPAADMLDFSLSAMLVTISALVTLIFLVAAMLMPIRRLGVLVFPAVALCLLFAWGWNSEPNLLQHSSSMFGIHILISLLAYCLLAIAAIQAILYAYQERVLKQRTNPAILTALPPLQTMEQLLFRLIIAGFALLSLTLLSGAVFSKQLSGAAFAFNHHTVLAILGWLVFLVLLLKRMRSGLRGMQAVIWTVSGFILIQLGYFGTKFVLESLNIQ